MMPLWCYLVVASALFAIGTFGVLTRRNAIVILMSVELMLNSANINLVAFWRYHTPLDMAGQVFAAFVIVVAAAEAAVGLAIIIAVYRHYRSIVVEEVDALRG